MSEIRLVVHCDHGLDYAHGTCNVGDIHTDPDAILEALAEKGVLDRKVSTGRSAPLGKVRYVSPWKEAK